MTVGTVMAGYTGVRSTLVTLGTGTGFQSIIAAARVGMTVRTVIIMDDADVLGVVVLVSLIMTAYTGSPGTGHPACQLMVRMVGSLGYMAAKTWVG
jgi:hypothetical protein